MADDTSNGTRTETPAPEAFPLFYGYDQLQQDAWRGADAALGALPGHAVLHWLTQAYGASQREHRREHGRRPRPLDLAELIIAAGHLVLNAPPGVDPADPNPDGDPWLADPF